MEYDLFDMSSDDELDQLDLVREKIARRSKDNWDKIDFVPENENWLDSGFDSVSECSDNPYNSGKI
jgi:hypothetical protein